MMYRQACQFEKVRHKRFLWPSLSMSLIIKILLYYNQSTLKTIFRRYNLANIEKILAYYVLLQISSRQMSQTNVLFWGNNQHSLLSPLPNKTFPRPSQASIPYQVVDLAASEKHIAFVTQDGSLYTYGLNLDGRLGIGGKPDARFSISNPAKVKLSAPVLKVKCGFSHTCVQLINQELYAWGLGDYGALGTGEFKSRGTPGKVQVKGKISNFSCGAMHSGFIYSEGNIFTCGSNEYGELGVNRPEKIATPILVSFSQKAKQIQCGVFYTLLLTAKGQVYGMGNNKYGQLGIGHKVNECHPTLVRELQGIVAISAGYHSGAIDEEGNLYIWGSGSFGQLLKPKKITLETPIDKIFIRGFFGVGISTSNQKVYAWGNNTYGELGRGNYQSTKQPVEISQLSNTKLNGFACGVNFFLTIASDKLAIKEQLPVPTTERQRYSYLQEERRSPYRIGVKSPLHYEEEILRNAERTVRTPARFNEVEQSKQRSRSRGEEFEVKQLISQEIRRSRNRQSGNYEELFISLSADYQTLLARFKAMQDHLEMKNRSLIAQKEELTVVFQDENLFLRQQIEILKKQLTLSKEELAAALSKRVLEKNEDQELQNQIKTLKDQFRLTIKQMQILQEELASKDAEIMKLKMASERESKIISGQADLSKELRIVKGELKATSRQLEEAEQQLARKNLETKQLKHKRLGSGFKDYFEETKQELNEMNKKNKILKDELRNANIKYESLEEELAIKTIELKDLKQKRYSNECNQKDEIQELNQEIGVLHKELKTIKDELKITLKKYDQIQEQLAVKNIELKDLKQKKMVYDETEDLKSEILTQREEIILLTKDNKSLKEELRSNIRRSDELQEEIDSKTSQINNLKRKIATKDEEIEDLKVVPLEVKQLKNKQKKLTESLRETTNLLNEKERSIGELVSSHKKIENELYKEIAAIDEEKIKLVDACERTVFERNKFEQAMKASQEAMIALEKHYQQQISNSMDSVSKLKEIQDLNEIRAGQLKLIIEEERKKHAWLFEEVETQKNKINEVQQEKKELFKIIEELKNKQIEDLKIYQDKIIEIETQSGANQERIEELQVELLYEKDYRSKYEDTINDLTDHKDRVCRELDIIKQEREKDKEKIKELNFQFDKAKTLKKEVEVLTLQLERVEASTREYRKEIQQILMQKEQILKQLRADLEKKQAQLQKLQEKYMRQTGQLNRDVKDLEKRLSVKNKESNDLKKEIERKTGDIDTLKDTIEKLNRKLVFKNQEFEKEVREHEKTTEEFNHLRRQYTKIKAEKEDVENRNDQLVNQKDTLEQKLIEKKRQIELVQGEVKKLEAMIENLKKQTQLAKKDLEQSNWALQESRRINDELSKANKEFAENQEHFTSKISELEGRVFQLDDENKSYTPRYEALLQRNKEMDDRNRQLSEMINKAIQIQAEAYKSNILKEVQINTGQIIQQFKEEQEFKSRSRRREVPTAKEIDPSEIENLPETRTPGLMSKIKQEPYNKLMQQKISMHRKKVSDSAQKLAGILQLGQSQGQIKSFERSMGTRREEDYEKINSQMESLNQQKHQFMEKINNFAQKLKIL